MSEDSDRYNRSPIEGSAEAQRRRGVSFGKYFSGIFKNVHYIELSLIRVDLNQTDKTNICYEI